MRYHWKHTGAWEFDHNRMVLHLTIHSTREMTLQKSLEKKSKREKNWIWQKFSLLQENYLKKQFNERLKQYTDIHTEQRQKSINRFNNYYEKV